MFFLFWLIVLKWEGFKELVIFVEFFGVIFDFLVVIEKLI